MRWRRRPRERRTRPGPISLDCLNNVHVGCCCGGCGCPCHQQGEGATRAVNVAALSPDPWSTRRGRWEP